MKPIDFIIIGVIVLIVGGAITYIVKKKKSGARCIGCPWAGQCGKNTENNCSCNNDDKK